MVSLKAYLKKVAKRSVIPTERNRDPESNKNLKDEANMDNTQQKQEISQIKVRLPRNEVPFFKRNNVTLIDR